MSKQRLCVYFISENDLVVHDYVLDIIKLLKKTSSYIMIITSSQINEKYKLDSCVDKVLEIDNEDYSIIFNSIHYYFPYSVIQKYQEFVLIKNSCYANANNSFEKMFVEMKKDTTSCPVVDNVVVGDFSVVQRLGFRNKYDLMKYDYSLADSWKILRRSCIRKIKKLLSNKTSIQEKTNQTNHIKKIRDILINAYLVNLYVEKNEITLLIKFNDKFDKTIPYLRLGENTVYPTKFLTKREKSLVKDLNSVPNVEFFIYKIPLIALKKYKFFTIELCENQTVKFNYIDGIPVYNTLDLKKYGMYLVLEKDKLVCLNKNNVLPKLIKQKVKVSQKIALLKDYIFGTKNIWLFVCDINENDINFQLFKYMCDNSEEQCSLVVDDQSLVEEKYRKSTVIRNSYQHDKLLRYAEVIINSHSYNEALPLNCDKCTQNYLIFSKAKWIKIKQNIETETVDNDIHRLKMGTPFHSYLLQDDYDYFLNNSEINSDKDNTKVTKLKNSDELLSNKSNYMEYLYKLICKDIRSE